MLSAQADNDRFWAFSGELYARPGVEAALLALQDNEGLDINIILFCLYAAEKGIAFDGDLVRAMRHIGEAWGEGLVGPLREARRRLKTFELEGNARNVVVLRSKVKSAELAVEKGMQAALSELLQGRRRSAEFGRALAERNVTSWLTAENIPMTTERARAFNVVLDQAFG